MRLVLFCPHTFNGGFLLNPIPHLSRQPILPGTEQPTLLKRGRLKDKIKRQLIPSRTARVAAPAAAVAAERVPPSALLSLLWQGICASSPSAHQQKDSPLLFLPPRENKQKKKAVRNVQA